VLSEGERDELLRLRDHAVAPYLRERAAALLRIAAGQSATAVARRHGLRRHRPETVGRWLGRYLAEGVAGLALRPGRGRKPAFPPSLPDGAAGPRGAARRRAAGAGRVGAGGEPLDAARPAGGL
jgi:hypothetical protein